MIAINEIILPWKVRFQYNGDFEGSFFGRKKWQLDILH